MGRKMKCLSKILRCFRRRKPKGPQKQTQQQQQHQQQRPQEQQELIRRDTKLTPSANEPLQPLGSNVEQAALAAAAPAPAPATPAAASDQSSATRELRKIFAPVQSGAAAVVIKRMPTTSRNGGAHDHQSKFRVPRRTRSLLSNTGRIPEAIKKRMSRDSLLAGVSGGGVGGGTGAGGGNLRRRSMPELCKEEALRRQELKRALHERLRAELLSDRTASKGGYDPDARALATPTPPRPIDRNSRSQSRSRSRGSVHLSAAAPEGGGDRREQDKHAQRQANNINNESCFRGGTGEPVAAVAASSERFELRELRSKWIPTWLEETVPASILASSCDSNGPTNISTKHPHVSTDVVDLEGSLPSAINAESLPTQDAEAIGETDDIGLDAVTIGLNKATGQDTAVGVDTTTVGLKRTIGALPNIQLQQQQLVYYPSGSSGSSSPGSHLQNTMPGVLEYVPLDWRVSLGSGDQRQASLMKLGISHQSRLKPYAEHYASSAELSRESAKSTPLTDVEERGSFLKNRQGTFGGVDGEGYFAPSRTRKATGSCSARASPGQLGGSDSLTKAFSKIVVPPKVPKNASSLPFLRLNNENIPPEVRRISLPETSLPENMLPIDGSMKSRGYRVSPMQKQKQKQKQEQKSIAMPRRSRFRELFDDSAKRRSLRSSISMPRIAERPPRTAERPSSIAERMPRTVERPSSIAERAGRLAFDGSNERKDFKDGSELTTEVNTSRLKIRKGSAMPDIYKKVEQEDAKTAWERALNSHVWEISTEGQKSAKARKSLSPLFDREIFRKTEDECGYQRRSESTSNVRKQLVPASPRKKLLRLREEEEEASRGRQLSVDSSSSSRPSGSWARFPSHSKHERNSSAGAVDHISTHDFADDYPLPQHSPSSSKEHHSLRHPLGQKNHHRGSKYASTGHKSVLRTLGERYRHERSDLLRMERGFRSSVSSGGQVEYPELELLPKMSPMVFSGSSSSPEAEDREGEAEQKSEVDNPTTNDHPEVQVLSPSSSLSSSSLSSSSSSSSSLSSSLSSSPLH